MSFKLYIKDFESFEVLTEKLYYLMCFDLRKSK